MLKNDLYQIQEMINSNTKDIKMFKLLSKAPGLSKKLSEIENNKSVKDLIEKITEMSQKTDKIFSRYGCKDSKALIEKIFLELSFNELLLEKIYDFFILMKLSIHKDDTYQESLSKIINMKDFIEKTIDKLNEKNNNKIILEINSNNSNFYFKKNITTNNIKNSNSNKLTKRKIEDKKDNPDFKKDNKIKTTRNRNLSMKDIENISNNSKNLNCTNSNKSKVIKENIIVKKIYQSDNKNNNKKINKINYPTSPSITDRNKISNKKSNNTSKKLNTLKKSDSNIIEIIEKKYNILFNNNLNENINTNNKIISSRNSIKGNYISIKNDNEFTKTNNLNSKNVKKIDELEGPENIHFSLVELIQKGRKKMEEIVDKLKNNNK